MERDDVSIRPAEAFGCVTGTVVHLSFVVVDGQSKVMKCARVDAGAVKRKQ